MLYPSELRGRICITPRIHRALVVSRRHNLAHAPHLQFYTIGRENLHPHLFGNCRSSAFVLLDP